METVERLTEDEKRLIDLYRQLDDFGRDFVMIAANGGKRIMQEKRAAAGIIDLSAKRV